MLPKNKKYKKQKGRNIAVLFLLATSIKLEKRYNIKKQCRYSKIPERN
ncbi:hypothetical protein [Citrobacter freundii]|uniref:Uncharacterized protein n=1 Tax=Citrobacter freundii TaxID=546 RepID=A0A7G2IHM5_CITFR|nr:hypothetical protein [Citrobacter freundii]